MINPNTLTCPIFRSKRDAAITKSIYQRVPVFVNDSQPGNGNPWTIIIRRIFNMGIPEILALCDSDQTTKAEERWMPMLESKMMHQFDHRWARYDGNNTRDLTDVDKANPNFRIRPRFWIPTTEVIKHLKDIWKYKWLIGWRDITGVTNERTCVSTILPFLGTDFTIRLGFPSCSDKKSIALLVSNFNSFIYDYVVRQKLGGNHLSDYIFKQLPVFPPETYEKHCQWSSNISLANWLLPYVLELTYTSWDLKPFGEDMGYHGPPFRWDPERRFLLRCELDAAFFHLYGIDCEDVDYIMDTFPIVKRKDEQQHGEYHTKRVILEMYDDMAQAIRMGQPYSTRLNPPPADPRVAHPQDKEAS